MDGPRAAEANAVISKPDKNGNVQMDASERRKLQNRNAQRAFQGEKRKRQLEELLNQKRDACERQDADPRNFRMSPATNTFSPPESSRYTNSGIHGQPNEAHQEDYTSYIHQSYPYPCVKLGLSSNFQPPLQMIQAFQNPHSSLPLTPQSDSYREPGYAPMRNFDAGRASVGTESSSTNIRISSESPSFEDLHLPTLPASTLMKQVQASGRTPLHKAVINGHEAIVQALLDTGADTSLTDSQSRTALHLAAENCHESIFLLLLLSGCNIECQDDHGLTALHKTAETGSESIVMLLLERGAKVDVKDKLGKTPLHVAVERGHLGVVQCLLDEGGANVNAEADDV
ncbi:hypothetical protein IFR05_000676 [Cadophora sp. M221]|nr:hypothetical protein IFR05_000676 [Cadophora sp. M221]